MAFFVTVPAGHLTCVPLGLIRTAVFTAAIGIDGVDPIGWNGAFNSLFLAAVVAVFLFFFSGLLNALLGALRGYRLRPGLLLIDPRVFYWPALTVGLVRLRPTALEAVLIGLSDIGTRPESGLGFGVNCFLDQLSKAV